MNKILLTLAGLSLFATSSLVIAEQPEKAKTCVACHGADGNSLVPNFPKIAGQHSAYLEKALKDYRDGFRKDPVMQGFARGLSDTEIKELADFYAAQEAK